MQDLAEANAKRDCWNREGRNTTLDSLKTSSDKADYKKYYTDAYKDYEKELAQAKKDVVTDGRDDAKAGKAPSYTTINSFRGYEAYTDLVNLYNEAYEKAGGELPTITNDDIRWKLEEGTWKCYNAFGTPVTSRWVASYDNWYYADANGIMKTGWLASGSNWYYFDASGKMVTGPRWIDGKIENFDNSGHWQRA